jgi:hypothetical protein
VKVISAGSYPTEVSQRLPQKGLIRHSGERHEHSQNLRRDLDLRIGLPSRMLQVQDKTIPMLNVRPREPRDKTASACKLSRSNALKQAPPRERSGAASEISREQA